MPIIEFENGEQVEFDQEPTDLDIEEAAAQLGISAATPDAIPDSKPDLLEKIGRGVSSIFPGEQIGKEIGTGLGNLYQAGKEKLGLLPKGTAALSRTQPPPASQVAGEMGSLALDAVTAGTAGLASGIKGALGVGARAAESGVIGAALQALTNISQGKTAGEKVGTAGAIGAAVPLGAGIVSGTKQFLGRGLKAAGEKIQSTVIRPTIADIQDGFRIGTINKYGLGGSLDQTLEKAQSKMNKLTNQLRDKLQRTEVVIDLNNIYTRTLEKLGGGVKEKARVFGNIASTKRVLGSLADEIEEVSANGLVDLPEAQLLKQAAGKKGAWVYGSADPDASAIERVYTTFYRELRKEIEVRAPAGVREINRQLSELIPVSHAVIRRIPVAERNNVLSLSDVINLGLTAVDPKAAALFTVNRLSKSGRVGSALARFGEKISAKTAPKTPIGQRLFGR